MASFSPLPPKAQGRGHNAWSSQGQIRLRIYLIIQAVSSTIFEGNMANEKLQIYDDYKPPISLKLHPCESYQQMPPLQFLNSTTALARILTLV